MSWLKLPDAVPPPGALFADDHIARKTAGLAQFCVKFAITGLAPAGGMIGTTQGYPFPLRHAA